MDAIDDIFGSVIQELINNGHSFSEIKTYTLGQLGVFYKSIKKINNSKKSEYLLLNWIANNADKKGIDKSIQSIEQSSKSEVQKQKKIQNDWKRLAMTAGKLT